MEARHTHNASPHAGTPCPERRSLVEQSRPTPIRQKEPQRTHCKPTERHGRCKAGGGEAFGRAKVNTDPSKPFCEPGVRPGVQTSQAFNQARRPDQTASLPVYAWTATPHKPLWDCACDHPSGPEGWSAVCGRGSPRKVGGSGTGCSTGGTKG